MQAKDFSDLLLEAGIPPGETMLLRHDQRGLSALKRGRDWFGSFISIQRADLSPVRSGARFAAQFVRGPALSNGSATAIFVGMTEVYGRWPWDSTRLPRLWLKDDVKNPKDENEAVDFGWLDQLSDRVGLQVNWGYAPRSWYQWADEKRKPLISGERNALAEALSTASMSLVLSEMDKRAKNAEYENAEIARELARNPELLAREFILALRETRPEQPKFRALLREAQGDACAITDTNVPEVLEAAHIIPFSEGRSCRDFVSNGLLLRSDIHKLFDRLLLSIDPKTMQVWLSPELRDGKYGVLHGKEIETHAAPLALAEHFRRSSNKR